MIDPKSSLSLTGSHSQTLDDRFRVALPAKLMPALRALSGVGPDEDFKVAVTVSPGDCVGIYPIPVLNELMEELRSAPPNDIDAAEQLTMFLASREDQDVDKQSRIRITSLLLDLYPLAGEVMVMGLGNHLQIRQKAAALDALRAIAKRGPERNARVAQSPWKNARYEQAQKGLPE